MQHQDKDSQEIVIEPSRGLLHLNLFEIWRYRELLYFLAWRDLKVRYRQTAIGVTWALLQPFFSMVIFTVFFGRLAHVGSEGIPYPVFSYSGLLLWIFFSQSATNSGNSLVGSSNLIEKVYFPRLIIPLSSIITGFIDYFIALTVLVAMMFYYGVFPNETLIFLPVVVIAAFVCAAGFGLWLSALNVKYRDVRHAIPFLIQSMLFVTPVIYPVTILPERFRWILSLNPIAGIIDAHRACLLGYKPINWHLFALSCGISAAIFISGLLYFRKTEHFFADII